MKKILIGLISLSLAGCAALYQVEHTMLNKFSVEQAQAQLKAGNSKLEGSALLRQVGGDSVTCAGEEVALYPYTDYANERMNLLYGNSEKGFDSAAAYTRRASSDIGLFFGNGIKTYDDGYGTKYNFTNEDPNYSRYKKTTYCDAQGKFTFDKLSEGSYFVITKVVWLTEFGNRQGGFLMQKVTLGKNDHKNIVMSY